MIDLPQHHFPAGYRGLVTILYGSHLYGTAAPESDVDIKGVFVPPKREILLQRTKISLSQRPAKSAGAKNSPGDVDKEFFSLQRFLKLLEEGQTVALDMLFAPPPSIIGDVSPEWAEICRNSDRLISRRSAVFVGYCRRQANKYGIKGSRIAAVREAIELLRGFDPGSRLGEHEEALLSFVQGRESASVVAIPSVGGMDLPHLQVCDRKVPWTFKVRDALSIYEGLFETYGTRARMAEANEGVDWKALSHAVRVGHQAMELLNTGHITFPLPNAGHIMAIKAGALPYRAVADEIEQLLVDVEDAAVRSPLPEAPDIEWMNDFIADVHRATVAPQQMSDIVVQAKGFATAAHAAVGQVRKYTSEPYINHPANVARIVSSVPHTKEMLAAAWLHDVVEDTSVELRTIYDVFGPDVAGLVYWLTDVAGDKGNRAIRKALDRERLARAPCDAKTIKLADLIDNSASILKCDPDFANVYLREKVELLSVLTSGDAELHRRASEQVMEAAPC